VEEKIGLIKPWLVLENIEVIRPLLMEMLIELGSLYGIEVTKNSAKLKVNYFILKQAPKFLVGGVITVTGVSEVTNATLAGLLTEKLGWEFVNELLAKTVTVPKDEASKKENFIEKTIMDKLGIDIPYEKRTKCHYVIHSAVSAVSGARMVTVPGLGKYSVDVIQVGMIVSLAKIFDIPMNRKLAEEYLLAVGNRKQWEVILKEVLSALPAGKITNATIDAILTERMGWQVAVEFNKKSKNN